MSPNILFFLFEGIPYLTCNVANEKTKFCLSKITECMLQFIASRSSLVSSAAVTIPEVSLWSHESDGCWTSEIVVLVKIRRYFNKQCRWWHSCKTVYYVLITFVCSMDPAIKSSCYSKVDCTLYPAFIIRRVWSYVTHLGCPCLDWLIK